MNNADSILEEFDCPYCNYQWLSGKYFKKCPRCLRELQLKEGKNNG